MSILYLFLCLLQFHTDADDSAVRIEKYSSIAKSILLSILIGSNKGTTFSFHKSVEFGLYSTTLDSRCQGRYLHHKIPYNRLGSYGFSTEDTVHF